MNKETKEVGVALALAGLLAVGTGIGIYNIDRGAKEAKRECLDTGQIDERGQKLEAFVVGQGCERFLATNRRLYYPYRPMGGW